MNELDSQVERFEENRVHLRAVAYRMLGSAGGAEDAVQEAWLRFSRSDPNGIENLRGWLTTIVARLCLDALRSRASRREEPLESDEAAGVTPALRSIEADPEHELVISDAVGTAMLKVLDTLEPAERVAFVLHDTFDVPFDEIASIVDRTPEAARKLASRARQKMQGADDARPADQARKREVIGAFLAASREGNFAALLALLDPSAVLRADAFAVRMGAAAQVLGQTAVGETFRGRAQVAQLALLDGAVGAVWRAGGQDRVAFAFTLVDGHIAAIDLIADPENLQKLDITLLS